MPHRACQGKKPRLDHILIHLAIALICSGRAGVYLGIGESSSSTLLGPVVLTNWGEWLWVFAIAWGVIALIAIIDLVRGASNVAIPAFIGMMFVWGAFYLVSFFGVLITSTIWGTATLFVGVAIVVYGLYAWVMRLQAIIRKQREKIDELELVTAPTDTVTGASTMEVPHD